MPSLVATMSTSARTTFVRMHFALTNFPQSCCCMVKIEDKTVQMVWYVISYFLRICWSAFSSLPWVTHSTFNKWFLHNRNPWLGGGSFPSTTWCVLWQYYNSRDPFLENNQLCSYSVFYCQLPGRTGSHIFCHWTLILWPDPSQLHTCTCHMLGPCGVVR